MYKKLEVDLVGTTDPLLTKGICIPDIWHHARHINQAEEEEEEEEREGLPK